MSTQKPTVYCYCLTNYYNGKRLFGLTRNPNTVRDKVLSQGMIPESDVNDLDYLVDVALGVRVCASSEDEQEMHRFCAECIDHHNTIHTGYN